MEQIAAKHNYDVNISKKTTENIVKIVIVLRFELRFFFYSHNEKSPKNLAIFSSAIPENLVAEFAVQPLLPVFCEVCSHFVLEMFILSCVAISFFFMLFRLPKNCDFMLINTSFFFKFFGLKHRFESNFLKEFWILRET